MLLLDDPTVGVDPNTREVMFRVLTELAATGATVVLRSSEPELARPALPPVLTIVREGRVVTRAPAGTDA